MRTHCHLALLILAAAFCSNVQAEEILLYTTKNPDQVRGIRANGNRDRLLYQGSLRDFQTKTELGKHLARHRVSGPSRYWTSIRTEERWSRNPTRKEWRIIEVYQGKATELVPWSPRPLSVANTASHRGR